MDVKAYLRDTALRSVSVLDVSTCGGANRGPTVMGYKLLVGARGSEIHELLFEGKVRRDNLKMLQRFDVVIAPWGLVPDRVVVDGVVANRVFKHDILRPGAVTAAWMRALETRGKGSDASH